MATKQGALHGEKPLSLPPSAHLSGGLGFEPHDRQKCFCMKLIDHSKGSYRAQGDFPILLISCTAWLVLPRSFLPALPSSSWSIFRLLDWAATGKNESVTQMEKLKKLQKAKKVPEEFRPHQKFYFEFRSIRQLVHFCRSFRKKSLIRQNSLVIRIVLPNWWKIQVAATTKL